jgi:cytochrome P450
MANKALATIPAHVPASLVYDFDIYADSARNGDPQGAHIALHGKAPDFFYTPRNGGQWIATRYADVQKIMGTPDLFSSAGTYFNPSQKLIKISLPPQDLDPPDHTKYRLLLMKFLAPKMVVQLDGQIRALMNELIDAVVQKDGCEFMAAISVPLPVKTFMTLMGMDLSRYREFVKWANGMLASEHWWQRLPSFWRMRRYMKSLVLAREKNPGTDPVSLLLAAEVDGKKLTRAQVQDICNLLFLGGLDTVTNAMTFIAKALAENPEQQQFLRDNPARIPAAVEEFLRRVAFANIPRRVTRDTEFNGITLRKDDMIITSLSAASNDERNVEHPEKIDFERPKSPHVAFNTGPHNCAGATLARLELRIFLEEWLKRIPPFRLAPDFHAEARGGPVMALEHLELRW